MSEADEYGPGGMYADGPNTDDGRTDEENHDERSGMTATAEIQKEQRDAWREEWPFEVELLPLRHLFADETYQRPRVEPFIARMVMAFDATLVGAIDVSLRAPTRFAILDGFQRTEAMREVGKKAAYCAVYTGMTVRDEAEFFIRKNRDRRFMHPYYALRARRVAGDTVADAVFSIAERTGFKLASSGANQTVDPPIVAISSLEETYNLNSLARDESLTPTLKTIRASFAGRPAAVDGTIIRGLGRFWQAFHDDEVVLDHLIEVLGAQGPQKLLGYATDRSFTSQHSKAYLVAVEVIKLYNKAMRRDQKLNEQFLDPAKRAKAGR